MFFKKTTENYLAIKLPPTLFSSQTGTLQVFLTKKKVNHDPPVLSIPLALPLTDCELSAQITDAKKQESLGSLSRDNSRPFFRVYPLHRSSSEVLPSNKRHMRGFKGFVYVLISSTPRAQEERRVGSSLGRAGITRSQCLVVYAL